LFLIKNDDGLAFSGKKKREKVMACHKWKPDRRYIYFFGVFINRRGNTISLRQQGIQTERNKKIKIPM